MRPQHKKWPESTINEWKKEEMKTSGYTNDQMPYQNTSGLAIDKSKCVENCISHVLHNLRLWWGQERRCKDAASPSLVLLSTLIKVISTNRLFSRKFYEPFFSLDAKHIMKDNFYLPQPHYIIFFISFLLADLHKCKVCKISLN